jgi:protein-disulfide isomerase
VDANCLNAQGNTEAFWDFADKVHTSAQTIGASHDLKQSQAEVDKIAKEIASKRGLNNQQLDACIAKDDKAPIERSVAEGDALGVNSTPTLFINGERLEGALPEENVKQALDEALKQAGGSTKK